MKFKFWTDGRVNVLRALWPVYSADEIADTLGYGCTKNMVIGKADRLDLPAKDRGAMVKRAWARISPTERKEFVRKWRASKAQNREARAA